jgi:DNA-binding NtrC family response regulator
VLAAAGLRYRSQPTHAGKHGAYASTAPGRSIARTSPLLSHPELFGHAKGAFTGAHQAKTGLLEAAHRGTLFLDEIAELPLALQAKLLRALQEGEVRRVGEARAQVVDVRVVCATHQDLASRTSAGLFREDLYYRLKVLTLKVAALAPAEAIDEEHLPEEVQAPSSAPAPGPSRAVAPGRTLAEVERAHVLATLEDCGGSASEAARALGIARNTLWRKLKRYG